MRGAKKPEIRYPTDRADLVWPVERTARENADYGYHYTPYNFDSRPESDFYEKVLRELNLEAAEVQDVYFTGAITDPRRTDLYIRVRGRRRSRAPLYAGLRDSCARGSLAAG